MSFPHSRSNITTYSPYNIHFPHPRSPNKNLPVLPRLTVSPYAPSIPFHNAYTSLPASMNRKGYYAMPLGQNASDVYGNLSDFEKQSLIRNKALNNPYNTYPFYTDPSVMWSSPGVDLSDD